MKTTLTGRLAPAVILLSAVTWTACTGGSGTETRTIDLAHLTPENAQLLVEPYLEQGRIRSTKQPPALTITAPAARLDQIEELLDRYDVPAPDVRLRFQLIEADGFTGTDSAVADVESSLRELFRFRGYRLVSESLLTMSARPGSGAEQQVIGPRDLPGNIAVRIGQVTTAEGRRAVELHVRLELRQETVLSTAVTIPEGQTIVLGTARPMPDMPALILVVRPQIQ